MNARLIALLIALAVGVGCSQDGGQFTADELEARIAKAHKWQDVSLQEPVDGVYRGTAVVPGSGANPEGMHIDLEVRAQQKAGGKGIDVEVKWTNEEGGSGVASSSEAWR